MFTMSAQIDESLVAFGTSQRQREPLTDESVLSGIAFQMRGASAKKLQHFHDCYDYNYVRVEVQ